MSIYFEKDGEWKTLLKNEKSFLCLGTKFYILIQRCNGRVLMGIHWGEGTHKCKSSDSIGSIPRHYIKLLEWWNW